MSILCLETQSNLLLVSVKFGIASHEYQHKTLSKMRHCHVPCVCLNETDYGGTRRLPDGSQVSHEG
jgi:hypothetical protein